MRKDARETLQRVADLLCSSDISDPEVAIASPTLIGSHLSLPKATAHAAIERLKAIATATGRTFMDTARAIHAAPIVGVTPAPVPVDAASTETFGTTAVYTSDEKATDMPLTAPTAIPEELATIPEAKHATSTPAPSGSIVQLLGQAARDIESLSTVNSDLQRKLAAKEAELVHIKGISELKPKPATDVADEDKVHVPAPIANWTPMAIEPAIEHCARAGWPVALVGPPGCGKSEVLRQTAARLGRPYIRISCSDGATVGDIIGRREVSDGATHFQRGPLTHGATRGFCVTLDEIGAAPAGVLASTHDLAATGQMHLPATRETIHAGAGWWLTATSNFLGSDRVDTTHEQPISAALADRFIVFQVDYGTDGQEAELAKRVLGLSSSSREIFSAPKIGPCTEAPVGDMAGLLADLRAAEKAGDISGPYSRRRLIDMVRLWLAWGATLEGQKMALRGALIDRHPPSQQDIVKGLVQRRLSVSV